MAECELYNEKRDVFKGETRKVNEGGMKSFISLNSSVKSIAILGDEWWAQTAKHDMCNSFLGHAWKKRSERADVVSTLCQK